MATPGITIKQGVAPIAPRPPGQTVIGLVGWAPGATPLVDSLTLVTSGADLETQWGTTGSLPQQLRLIYANTAAQVVVLRVADPAGGAPSPADTIIEAGIAKLADESEATVGVEPHLLLAPEATWVKAAAQPWGPVDPQTPSGVVAALETAAEKLSAIAIVTSPPGTIAFKKLWADQNHGDRLYALAHGVIPQGGAEVVDPAGAAAGALARLDSWANTMMADLEGITRVSPPVSWHPSGSDDAASLQASNITALIHHQGVHLWGATLNVAVETDPRRFVGVRREADDIDIHLFNVSLEALRQNIIPGFGDYVVRQVNAYIQGRVAQGALQGGSVALDAANNTPENIAQGRAYFLVTLNPAPPAQHLTYTTLVDLSGLTL